MSKRNSTSQSRTLTLGRRWWQSHKGITSRLSWPHRLAWFAMTANAQRWRSRCTRRRAPALVERERYVRAFDDDRFSRSVDQLDDSPKGITIVSSIGRQQFDPIELGARRLISALPTQLKVLSQKRNCASIVDPQHHV